MDVRVNESTNRFKMRGDVWVKIGAKDRNDILETPDRCFKNLIVDVCSDLIASWAFTGIITNVSDHIPGILVLAVGTGAIGWDLQNPPVETANETQLYAELARKQFASKTYVDPISGNPSVSRTNIIDFMTTFLESEAVGPLVEMGLFGGSGALSTNGGTMINAKNHPVINKPSTATLSYLWRLTF